MHQEQNRFQVLRHNLSQIPSKENWQKIAHLLEHWPDTNDRQTAQDYAKAHLADWPPTVRQFQKIQTTHPMWSLVRSLYIRNPDPAELNEQLPHTSLQYLEFEGASRLGNAAFVPLPCLKGLSLKNCQHPVDLAILREWLHLKWLYFENCDDLRNPHVLSAFTQLTQLAIHSSSIRLSHIVPLRALQKLHLTGPHMLYCTGFWERFPDLESISWHSCITLQVLHGMADLPKLKTLSLQNFYLHGDFGLLSDFTQLKHLDLSYCGGLQHVRFLSPLTQLEELILSNCYQLQDIRGLATLQHLRKLDISHCYMLKDLSVLQDLHQLQELRVEGCPWANKGVSPLRMSTHTL